MMKSLEEEATKALFELTARSVMSPLKRQNIYQGTSSIVIIQNR